MGDRQPPPDIGGLISLKVDNIPFTMTKIQLQEIFQEHGDVRAAPSRVAHPRRRAYVSFCSL